jgi:hypothetical protein
MRRLITVALVLALCSPALAQQANKIQGKGGTIVEELATPPVGTETGLVTRPIISGTLTTQPSTVGTANEDGACPSGAANFTVVSANASRKQLMFWASPANTDDVYIKLGAVATTGDARLAPGQPVNFVNGRIYTGQVDAVPASGTQAVCLFELN